MKNWKWAAVLAVALLAINIALNTPLFQPGEMPYRDSIEGGYASMARFISAHPNPWGWNPTEYCGLPTQFTYLPGLPYLTAAFTRLVNSPPEQVYRVIAALFACLGPSTLFLFALHFTRSLGWSLAVGLAYTFYSPCYYLIETIDKDRGIAFLPWRLQVLVKYGEGPHNAGLTLLPLALIAVWVAGTGRRYWQIFVAALLPAAIALLNWVAALALAFCCLLLLFTMSGASGFRPLRVLSAAALAYGLACFWLTPTFVKTIALNWPADAFQYHLQRQQTWLLCGLGVGLALIRLLFWRLWPERRYLCFLLLNLFGFGWVVLWFYAAGAPAIPEARRYALEFEMFLLLALCEFLRTLSQSGTPPLRFFGVYAALILAVAGWGQMRQYITQGARGREPVPFERSIEYRLAKRIEALRPRGRVFASGGLRFRMNSWQESPQVGGVFESGLRKRVIVDLAYQVRTGMNSLPGHEGQDALARLKVLGAEYLVVHGVKSREHYRDYQNPEKFAGLLTPVYTEEDDIIYSVPFRSLAHLVKAEELPPGDVYVQAISDEARPTLAAEWLGPGAVHIEGPVAEGQMVTVLVNYDAGWRAWQDGRPVAVEEDKLGYLLIRANPSAAAHIELGYHGTIEQRVMGAVSLSVWLVALVALWRRTAPFGRGSVT